MSYLNLSSPILIANDHGAFDLKNNIISHFKNLKFKDLGCDSSDSVDYPDFAHSLIKSIDQASFGDGSGDPPVMGLLLCGSGQGMTMTANKYKNIRAALCWSEESALLSRSHNNAQILCLGARLLPENTVFKIIQTFFSTPFEGGRHLNRINKI